MIARTSYAALLSLAVLAGGAGLAQAETVSVPNAAAETEENKGDLLSRNEAKRAIEAHMKEKTGRRHKASNMRAQGDYYYCKVKDVFGYPKGKYKIHRVTGEITRA